MSWTGLTILHGSNSSNSRLLGPNKFEIFLLAGLLSWGWRPRSRPIWGKISQPFEAYRWTPRKLARKKLRKRSWSCVGIECKGLTPVSRCDSSSSVYLKRELKCVARSKRRRVYSSKREHAWLLGNKMRTRRNDCITFWLYQWQGWS